MEAVRKGCRLAWFPATPQREAAMKLTARLHRGDEAREQQVELLPKEAQNGSRKFRIGNQTLEAQIEEITPGVYSFILKGKTYEAFVSKRPGEGLGTETPYVVAVGQRRYLIELS